MSKTTCMNCKYMTKKTGSAACAYVHGLKGWLKLLLFGPKPLFKTESCEHFASKKIKQKYCEQHMQKVVVSKHNAMGRCKCIGCTSPLCDGCLFMHNVQCTACLQYTAKVRGN